MSLEKRTQRVQWMHLFIEVCRMSAWLSLGPISMPDLDQRSNVLVFDGTLALDLVEASAVCAVSHRLVLEIALSSLVADGAVEGVVGEQELHDALTSLVDERRVGLDHHAGLYGPGARGDRLGSALYLDQAHTTTSGNHELLVVAVSRDRRARLFAGLDEGRAGCSGGVRRVSIAEGGGAVGGVPSIDTFFPSAERVSRRGRHEQSRRGTNLW